jgi:hypothetical protein
MQGGIAGRVTVVIDRDFAGMEFDESIEKMDRPEIDVSDGQSLNRPSPVIVVTTAKEIKIAAVSAKHRLFSERQDRSFA